MDIKEEGMNQFGQDNILMTTKSITTLQTTNKMTREVTTKDTDIRPNISQVSLPKHQSSSKRLPSFLLSNIQSFGNSVEKDKTTELEAMLEINNIDIACITETWLTENTKNQVVFNGYTSFHSVRRNVQRSSGGISIFVNEDFRLVKKLNVKVPEHIETLWISVRPNWLPRAISVIIVAGVYYPGKDSIYAPSQEDIILHLTESIHQLYQDYANPLFVVMGDFNDLEVGEICDACNLQQVVNVPTRKDATLYLILSNSDNKFYKTPYTLPSIGKSDHLCVLYEPVDNQNTKITKETITIRRFKKYALIEFGSWLTKFEWHDLLKITDVNLKISYFFTIMWIMIDKFFPLIKVVVTKDDKK